MPFSAKDANGAIYITIEDETGDAQLFVRADVFERYRRALNSQVILARDVVARWDMNDTIEITSASAVSVGVDMPAGHDWH